MKITEIEKIIKTERPRSAWERGVQAYAIDLLADATDYNDALTLKTAHDILLDGASSWEEYSEGGLALIYNEDICERLCTPSEQRLTKRGRRNPNSHENWIDCQARALYQAERLILETIRNNDVAK